MPPRRPHKKSRNGCLQCKARRVKCNETLPRCAQCSSRGLQCSFQENSHGIDIKSTASFAPTVAAEVLHRVSPPEFSASTTTSPQTRLLPRPPLPPPTLSSSSISISHHDTLTPQSLPDSSSLPLSDRALELELMHVYSTSTYKACMNKPDCLVDQYTWQTFVPRLALKFDFLMQGLLAFAALHVAVTVQDARNPDAAEQMASPRSSNYTPAPAEDLWRPTIVDDEIVYAQLSRFPGESFSRSCSFYYHKALEYQNLAFSAFRPVLDNLTAENTSAAYAFSVVAMALAVVSPKLSSSTAAAAAATTTASDPLGPITQGPFETYFTMFEFLKGIGQLSTIGREWLAQGPFLQFIDKYTDLWTVETPLDDPDAAAAFARLFALNAELSENDQPVREMVFTSNANLHDDHQHHQDHQHDNISTRDNFTPSRFSSHTFQVRHAAITHLQHTYAKTTLNLAEPSHITSTSTCTITTNITTSSISSPPAAPHHHNKQANSQTSPYASGLVMQWLATAGPEFFTLLRSEDGLSLLIFMHWGVLLRQFNGLWWSRNADRALVAEAARILHARGPEWVARTAWARRMVGLPCP